MKLTAQDIRSLTFSVTRRGYDRSEVDGFRSAVVETIADYERALLDVRRKLAVLERDRERVRQAAGGVESVYLDAVGAKADLMERARSDVARMVAEAEQVARLRAQEILDGANARSAAADAARLAAEDEARSILEQALAEAATERRRMLEEALAMLRHAEERSADPESASRTAAQRIAALTEENRRLRAEASEVRAASERVVADRIEAEHMMKEAERRLASAKATAAELVEDARARMRRAASAAGRPPPPDTVSPTRIVADEHLEVVVGGDERNDPPKGFYEKRLAGLRRRLEESDLT